MSSKKYFFPKFLFKILFIGSSKVYLKNWISNQYMDILYVKTICESRSLKFFFFLFNNIEKNSFCKNEIIVISL